MDWTLFTALLALIIGLAGFIFGSVALVIAVGMMRSTHTIQWKPMEEPEANAVKPDNFNFMDDITNISNF